ncbi:YtpI family protein [Paenibacillus sp. KQZ6P-2]|uniref:YtpI family protein n=1 Tax=Paenibacillus mangrovi TaxID=2931978 RepID=A0A9X1WR72_9BACL|nr:YtpI family protein [Paenibacillus mangrovi]MCJ8010174.1 YtpI family protein [Paenibacillus mangrovi]
MVSVIRYILFALLVIACICAALYSSRSRRSRDARERGLYGAVTNIFMGIMLVALALIFMFIFRGSTVAVIVEGVFLVIGAFNIFAGIRNRGYYSRMKSSNM